MWNSWAEGKFSSFRSQHIGNHKVECISFVLVPAFNVPGFPLGNACLRSPWPFLFCRSQVRFHPLYEALSVNSGGIVWVPHADLMWGWQNSLPPFESTSLVGCLYFWKQLLDPVRLSGAAYVRVMLASWPPFCYSWTVLSCDATSQGWKFREDTATSNVLWSLLLTARSEDQQRGGLANTGELVGHTETQIHTSLSRSAPPVTWGCLKVWEESISSSLMPSLGGLLLCWWIPV